MASKTSCDKTPNMALMMTSYPKNFLRKHTLDTTGLSDIPYGHELKKEFGLMQDIIFLNHGSYGTVPKRVLKLQQDYNEEREQHPDLFFRLNAKQYMDMARRDVASMINAKMENVQFVSNATTALNTLVRCFPFKSGDAILDTSHTYGAIKNLTSDFTSRIRPDVERINLTINLPIKNEDDIVTKYEDALEKHSNIKVAIIDHITSPSAVVLPLSKLIKLCHRKGVVVFIDGAHSLGQLPLDMEALQPDAFTSNLHKWCYTPRGCAFLWFNEKNRHWVNPPNTSWQIRESMDAQFFDQGTRDHVPNICAQHGLQFYNAIGGMEKIVGYTTKLADEAIKLLKEKLGLETIDIPPSMEAPNMRLIKLPNFPKYSVNEENVWTLHKELFGNSKIFGILCPVEGSFYIRFSTQVYNELDDFVKLVEILQPFIEKHTQE